MRAAGVVVQGLCDVVVAVESEDVVAVGLDDGLGGLALAMQRVGGDDRVGDVDRVEKCSQHGDLVGLGSDGELGEHGAGGLAPSGTPTSSVALGLCQSLTGLRGARRQLQRHRSRSGSIREAPLPANLRRHRHRAMGGVSKDQSGLPSTPNFVKVQSTLHIPTGAQRS